MMSSILVVDDQPYVRELLSQELDSEDFSVEGVTDAESVIEYLRNSKPDLVLLDLYLDGFKGWDVLHDIKSRHPHLPVLIFTAYDSHAEDPRVSEADGYMVKSFGTLGRLKQTITELLNTGTA
jgi:CheY-like chemotaxis protein